MTESQADHTSAPTIDRSRWTPDLFIAIGAAVLAAVLTLAATRVAPVLTSDSTYYLTGAESFADGHTPLDFNDWPITTFPPGYGAAIAVGVVAGVSPSDSARAVNALCAALIVLLTFLIARRHMCSRWGPLLVTFVVALSPGWTHVTVAILSEALFGVFVLAFLWLLDRIAIKAPDDGVRPGLVVALGAIAGLSGAVRHLGLALLAAGAIALLLVLWSRSRTRAVAMTALFLATSVVVPFALALRNISLGTGPFGDRASDTSATVPGTLRKLFDVTRDWFSTPDFGDGSAVDAMRWVIVIGLIAVVIAALVRTRSQPAASRHARSIAPVAIVVITLSAWLVASAVTTPIDPIDLRLAAPFFAPAMILIGWSIEGLTTVPVVRRSAQTAVVVVVAAWLALAGISALTFASRPDNHGETLLLAGDLTSPLTDSVRALPDEATVYANNPWRLWVASDRGSRLAPRARGYQSTDPTNDLPELVAAVARDESCGKRVYLAWYTDKSLGIPMHPLDALREELDLTPVGQADDPASDNALYEITTRDADLPPCKSQS